MNESIAFNCTFVELPPSVSFSFWCFHQIFFFIRYLILQMRCFFVYSVPANSDYIISIEINHQQSPISDEYKCLAANLLHFSGICIMRKIYLTKYLTGTKIKYPGIFLLLTPTKMAWFTFELNSRLMMLCKRPSVYSDFLINCIVYFQMFTGRIGFFIICCSGRFGKSSNPIFKYALP